MGAGIGVELSILDNFSFTFNYGWALKDLEAAEVERGDSQMYFLGSINF
jgi:hemolysin activation/secretion protein